MNVNELIVYPQGSLNQVKWAQFSPCRRWSRPSVFLRRKRSHPANLRNSLCRRQFQIICQSKFTTQSYLHFQQPIFFVWQYIRRKLFSLLLYLKTDVKIWQWYISRNPLRNISGMSDDIACSFLEKKFRLLRGQYRFLGLRITPKSNNTS